MDAGRAGPFHKAGCTLFDFIKDNLERMLELENTLSIVLVYV